MKKLKKGFTIVELVIVIAVIAILAAVLIPVFSNVVEKANQSADQQAVRQMNTALAVESALDEDVSIYDVFDALAEAGMDAKDYKALCANRAFFYDGEINRVLYVDTTTGRSIYPEEYKGRTNNGFWQTLTQTITASRPDTAIVDKTASVDTASELAYAVKNYINDGGVEKIAISEDIDMMGAAFAGGALAKSLTIEGTGSEPVVIKNITATQASKTYAQGGAGHDGIYNAGLFTEIKAGVTLTLRNIVIENVNIRDIDAGNIGFLVGSLSGTLILENVAIVNSSIAGHRNTGALVGYTPNGTAEIVIKGEVILDNVSVQTVAGRSGKLIGFANSDNFDSPESTGNIFMNNVSLSIYECDLNTGVFEGTTLGLNNGVINAKKPQSAGGFEKCNYYYLADTTIGNYDEANGLTLDDKGNVPSWSVPFAEIQSFIKPWAESNWANK